MIPGPLTGSARSRLLPPSVPFRYFGAATVFHVAGWLVLLAGADALAGFAGGLGPVFAALHLMTLGVLSMTAIGATLQLLPVATRQPVRSVGAAKFVWWLLVTGVAVFTAGAGTFRPAIMAPGAMLVVIALGIYAWLLGENLRGARGMRVVVAHGWWALGALVLLAATGLAVVARYEHGFDLDHRAFAASHLVLATYGFMGLLAMGLTQFLLPMFALAPAPSPRSATLTLRAAVFALALAVAGFWVHETGLVVAAALVGAGAGVAHVITVERALAQRLRPPLGPEFLLIRVAWACLIASLLVGALAALEAAPARVTLLFAILLVPGWLLTFVLAVLQRIVPFLATAHASGSGKGVPLASELTPAQPLTVHRWCHLLAMALLLAGAAAGSTAGLRAGATLGVVAALAYLAFFAGTLLRLREARGRASPLSGNAGA